MHTCKLVQGKSRKVSANIILWSLCSYAFRDSYYCMDPVPHILAHFQWVPMCPLALLCLRDQGYRVPCPLFMNKKNRNHFCKCVSVGELHCKSQILANFKGWLCISSSVALGSVNWVGTPLNVNRVKILPCLNPRSMAQPKYTAYWYQLNVSSFSQLLEAIRGRFQYLIGAGGFQSIVICLSPFRFK